MLQVLTFALLGIGQGSAFALTAQGMVLTYRGSGVVNLAHGAIGMVAAYTFYELRVAHGWAAAPAFAVSVLASTLTGLLIQVVVMRRLRNSAVITKLIATLGVLVFLVQAIVLRYQGHALSIPSVLPKSAIDFGDGVSIGVDRAILFGIAVAVTVVLHLVYKYTKFGLATSACAENEVGLASLGWSPQRIAAANWLIGSALSGAAAILIAGQTGLSPDLAFLVIPALAAALVGRLQSFPGTLAAAIAIGVAESEAARYVSTPGLAESVPFLFVMLFLFLRGRALPARGEVGARLPRVAAAATRRWTLPAAAVGGVVAIQWVLSETLVNAVITSLLLGIVILSVVLVTGMAGQLSLAQYSLAGIAALISVRFAAHFHSSFAVSLLVGLVTMVPIAFLAGLPALRLRGMHLAVVTLAFAYVTQQLVLANFSTTGGFGGTPIDSPTLFGLDLDSTLYPRRYAMVVLAAFVLVAWLLRNVRRSPSGRRLLAVRSNERAASSLGVNVIGSKLYAFTTAGVIAGLGGVLTAFQLPFAVFSGFNVIQSVFVVGLAVVGGIGYVGGGFVGGAIAPGGIVNQLLTSTGDITQWITLFGGLAVVMSVMFSPDGAVAGLRIPPFGWLARARAGRVTADSGPDSGSESASAPAAEPVPVPVRPRTLVVSDVHVTYGAVRAVDGASLTVSSGHVVGMMGPNGAGKTTLLDAVSGFARCSEGRITLDTLDITGLSPVQRARAGLGRSFQALELFDDMTVRENLLVACDDHRTAAYFRDLAHPPKPVLTDAALAAIADFGLEDVLDSLPTALSAGRRRQVAIARAVAARPSVLCLDEPAAGLDFDESRELARLIRLLADKSAMAVLLVEHDTELVFGACDEVVVLDFGKVIARGTPDQVRDDPAVVAAYLGDGPGESEARPADAVDQAGDRA